MRLIGKKSRFAAIALSMLSATLSVHADEPLKLPGEQTFDRLESALTELRSADADSVRREIASAEQLLARGRLWVDAGRLRQAGLAADRLTLTIKLIRLLQKNKAQEALAKQAEQRTETLERRAAELKEQLARLIAETKIAESQVANTNPSPSDAPATKESP